MVARLGMILQLLQTDSLLRIALGPPRPLWIPDSTLQHIAVGVACLWSAQMRYSRRSSER